MLGYLDGVWHRKRLMFFIITLVHLNRLDGSRLHLINNRSEAQLVQERVSKNKKVGLEFLA